MSEPEPSGVQASTAISVVIATKNAADTLDRCLQSIRDQNYPPTQIVIMDACSIDTTAEIANQWLKEGDVFVSEPDAGIYDAWNKAIQWCSGDWIAFLGADDYLPHPHVFRQAGVELASLDDNIEIAYGRVEITTATGQPVMTLGKPWAEIFRRHEAGGTLPHPGSFHRRSVFTRVGLFDSSYRIAGDFEFQLRALKERTPHFLSEITTAVHQLGGVSGTEKAELSAIQEVLRARRSHGHLLPSRKLAINFAYAITRRFLFAITGEERARRLLDRIRRLLGRDPYWSVQ